MFAEQMTSENTMRDDSLLRSVRSGMIWAVGVAMLLLCLPASAEPGWWAERGVIDTNAAAADYAPALLGQLKWFAVNAADELDDNLPNGVGSTVQALVASFDQTGNYSPASIGQLKNVAQPFYVRLIAEGYTSVYPWTVVKTDDNDRAIADLGRKRPVEHPLFRLRRRC